MDEEYWLRLTAGCSIVVGAFLLLEHLFTWGGFDPKLGHEWYGLMFIVAGSIVGLWTRKKDG